MGSLLIITGSMGAGKTSVLGEASDILARRQIVHAAIDVDALGVAYLPATTQNDKAMYCNLRSICANYAAIGVTRSLRSRAVQNRSELEIVRGSVSATDVAVCRLTASVETLERRVKLRESGISQQEYVSRVADLSAILDHTNLEDFILINENRTLTEVAQEMLFRAGWLLDSGDAW